MNAEKFVQALASIRLPNVFNPYADQCGVHDQAHAAESRRNSLRSYLDAVQALGVDTIWMGRDLGHRGGRRTGLALTDEQHLSAVARRYPGAQAAKVTTGPIVKERTAAEIWRLLDRLDVPPLLWNVFPFHPHEVDAPFTNRKFTAGELRRVDELNAELVKGLGIRRIIAIGDDAARYGAKFGAPVERVRHPSFGGTSDFRTGMQRIYKLQDIGPASSQQGPLF